jgi:hypothetical protein
VMSSVWQTSSLKMEILCGAVHRVAQTRSDWPYSFRMT